MSLGDLIYKHVIRNILEFGKWDKDAPVRTRWKDGSPAYTKSILNAQMKFENGGDILDSILTQKRVPRKDPLIELFWIWRNKSNDVNLLNEMGCKVWDEWKKEDGTIGKAYGWQLANKKRKVRLTAVLYQMYQRGEISGVSMCTDEDGDLDEDFVMLDQVDWLIYTLATNPYSRRIKTTLWCVEDLDDMALEPCVYETHWQKWGGKLNLTVNIRSNDMGLGNPYNVYQYSILHRLIAQVTGHEVGEICFNIDNAHIYDRHIGLLEEQVERPTHQSPKIWINPDITSFYDFTTDDIKLIDYECGDSIKMEVAI